MPGINQLPEGAEGAAALSLIYASISWICSALMIWLTWVHHERLSYVAIVAYWSCVSTMASIAQQIHDITWWEHIMWEQFKRTSSFVDNPELAIANGSYGLDLALYYIQYYTYNVEAMCVLFWAGELAQSIYGWDANPKWKYKLRRINKAGKVISMVFPLITVLLLRVPAIQRIFVVFIILADIPLMLSLTMGSATVVAILIRYVRTRKKFTQWTPPNNSTVKSDTDRSSGTAVRGTVSDNGDGDSRKKNQGIYDRWLMVRFTCAFVVLSVFDVTNTLFQVTATQNNRKDTGSTEPDLSVGRANSTLFLFMPGVTPGVFLFIIFGTTAGYRRKMYETFVPRRWQKPAGARGPRIAWSRGRVWPWIRVSGGPASAPTPTLPVSNPDTAALRSRSDMLTVKSDHLMKPLPPAPGPLRSVFTPTSTTSSRPWDDDDLFSADAAIRMKDLEAGAGTGTGTQDQYYAPNPEQSDDSGPVLPIMQARDSHVWG
ncbi:hypothetical protein F4780DRAFT_533217 [Xylariomycetidae sp. FL0641]|nr:hypothetical protein F4780DRAFT_533217 [Xylariomycetidae sp. FL0641]